MTNSSPPVKTITIGTAYSLAWESKWEMPNHAELADEKVRGTVKNVIQKKKRNS